MGKYDRDNGRDDEQNASGAGQLLYDRTVGLYGRRRARSGDVGPPRDADHLQAGQETVRDDSHTDLLVRRRKRRDGLY